MQIKNKHSIIIIILLIVFLFIEALYLYVIPRVLDIGKKSILVEKIFHEKTGANITIKEMKLYTYADFSFGLSADKLTISNSTKNMVDAEKIFVRVPLFPLLFKEINVKNITAQKLKLDVERYKNGKLNLESLLFKSEKKIFEVKLKNTKFNISKYGIRLNDKKLNKKCEIRGNYFKIDNFTMKKLIDVETQGTITGENINTDYQIKVYSKLPIVKNLDSPLFTVSGFVKNFEPKYFAPYIQQYSHGKIKDVSGSLSFHFYTQKQNQNKKQIFVEGAVNDLVIKNSKPEETVHAVGRNTVFAKINLDKKEINILEAFIKGNKYQINAEGKIKDYKTKKPYLDLKANIPKSRVEYISYLLPANLIPNREEIRKVKKYGIMGDIQADLQVKGKIPQPNIVGSVDGTDIHVVNGMEKTHTGTIHLTFEKRKLITNVKIKLVKSNEYITVKGLTYIFRDGLNHFVIDSSEALDLYIAQKLLLPIQDVFQFQLGPVPQMKFLKGTGDVFLDIKGTKLSGEVKGYVSFKNASASYNDIEAVLHNGQGIVNFYGKKIGFKTTNAYIDKYPIEIFGDAVINGLLDFNIASSKVDSRIILGIVNNSKLLEEIKEKLVVLTEVSGPTSFKLNIKAKINPQTIGKIDPKEAFKNMKVLGSLNFQDASCQLQGFKTPIHSVKGSVNFTESKVDFLNLTGKIESSPVKIYGDIKNNLITNIPTINFYVEGKKIQLKDSLKFLLESDISKDIDKKIFPFYKLSGQHDLSFNYKSSSKDVDLDGISFTANFIPQNIDKSVKINSGRITLSKGHLKVENVNTKIYNTVAKISGTVSNLYSKKPSYDLGVKISDFDIKALNDISKYGFLPKSVRATLSQYSEFSGLSDISLKFSPVSVTGQIGLSNVHFSHKETKAPITINNANIRLESNKIVAESLDANIGNSPIFAEFVLSDLLTNPTIKGYLTTKITDDFIDNYINNKLSYPIKVKGDISLTADFSGNLNNIEFNPTIRFNEGSDISYLSSNLGDDNDIREIEGNMFITKKAINIKKLEYKKYLTSQNNKLYPMNFALIKGTLIKNKQEKYELDSLLIKTNNNMPTRLLNFMFKKSILKHGTFNCSIFYKANTKTNIPKVFGNIDFKNIDIPLFDTLIKDISIDSSKDIINLDIKGTIFNSDLSIKSSIANKLIFPIDIKNLEVSSKKFDSDRLLDTLNKMSLEAYQNKAKQPNSNSFDIVKILIRKGHIKADEVSFKSLPANNLSADFTLNDKSILNVNNINFDVAGGTLTGESEYDFKARDFETTLISKNVDANLMSEALFDMKNQIYGKTNGHIYIHTKGTTQEERLKNLSGRIYFNILDGRMPKLGSLEYLLKASNIVKSGITGLTINSIIDIVNPIKTGNFSAINGGFVLDNGIAKNVEIFSKGENLSIYVKGTYDLIDSNADMKVLGKLSKKMPTLLGPIGNASINSLFNVIPGMTLSEADKAKFMKDISKIPGLDFTNDDYRVFQAKIDGNINGSAYVSSFKWVE